MENNSQERRHRLAKEFIEQGKPCDFFEIMYKEADGNPENIPWADMSVNPIFEHWLEKKPLIGAGKKALVIGSGLGDDAEKLCSSGFDVTAFDIAPTAIRWTKRRFPSSKVHYHVEDLFSPPTLWVGAFDFVLEIYTIQSLAIDIRKEVIACIAMFLRPKGELLVLCRGRNEDEIPVGPPWPVCKKELNCFLDYDLKELQFEDFFDDENPPVRRFRTLYKQE